LQLQCCKEQWQWGKRNAATGQLGKGDGGGDCNGNGDDQLIDGNGAMIMGTGQEQQNSVAIAMAMGQ
jgi:hypothetical protein